MENSENKPLETTEEANSQPTREEILAISREENKNGDEMDRHVYKTAIQIAYGVGLLLTGIVILVSTIFSELPTELMIVYMGMAGATGMYCGVKFTRRRALFLASGVICLISCVAFIVIWILQLCGVM